ncbi:MAG: adenylate/guanylate cyclase domain-containing protein [Saprospiraceae bacterium]
MEQRTERLSEDNKAKSEELISVSEQKQRVEQLAAEKAKEVDKLSDEVIRERYKLEQKEKALMEVDLRAAQAEVKAQQQQIFVYAAAGASGIMLLLAMLMYLLFTAKKRTAKSLEAKNSEIEQEKQRSEELLLNILPASIAQELKVSGTAKARKYQETTVLFSDFKNFTGIAEKLSPEELVQELDTCFKAFDDIVGKYDDLEKIKTIGDAYMCAGGLTNERTMPNNMVKAALEMQAFLEKHKGEQMRLGKPYFEARIGIHTGPVVAGVVGSKKFAYDIWGDTVNTAARVEANSEPGKVNVSETTYNLIKYAFNCHHRGKVEAKNKGLIDMYFVEGSV